MGKRKGSKQGQHPTAKVQQEPKQSDSSPAADDDNDGSDVAPCLPPARSGWRCCCCGGVRKRLGSLLAGLSVAVLLIIGVSVIMPEELPVGVGEGFSHAINAIGLNGTGAPQDWIQKHIGWDKTSAYKRAPDRVGVKLAKEGLTAKYPIILVPGFVTSGLELWSAQECFKGAPPLTSTACAISGGVMGPGAQRMHACFHGATLADPQSCSAPACRVQHLVKSQACFAIRLVRPRAPPRVRMTDAARAPQACSAPASGRRCTWPRPSSWAACAGCGTSPSTSPRAWILTTSVCVLRKASTPSTSSLRVRISRTALSVPRSRDDSRFFSLLRTFRAGPIQMV